MKYVECYLFCCLPKSFLVTYHFYSFYSYICLHLYNIVFINIKIFNVFTAEKDDFKYLNSAGIKYYDQILKYKNYDQRKVYM